MEANELSCKDLMVGDWVIPHVFDSTLKPSKIVGIHYNSYKGKDYVDWVDCEVWDELSMNDIEPIPLTPEILKKNGFKREGGASYWHEGGHDACILHWNKDKVQLIVGCPSDDYMVKMNVKHVHELQHAFRLCGIEKEFEL